MKICIYNRLGKKFPYFYANNCPKEIGEYKFERTFYILNKVLVIKLFRNI